MRKEELGTYVLRSWIDPVEGSIHVVVATSTGCRSSLWAGKRRMTRLPLPLTAAVTESLSALRWGKVRRCARRDSVQTEGERATLRPWPMRTRIGSLERLEALDDDVLVLIGLGASGCWGAG